MCRVYRVGVNMTVTTRNSILEYICHLCTNTSQTQILQKNRKKSDENPEVSR